jgi:phosphatidylserine/phosphatidylglycerophosphate/cardiolipin synthase-like enzyme
MAKTLSNEIHFGGPDFRSGRLRDLLSEYIEAVPPGGYIDWVTYYFRNRQLAQRLIKAHRRGVRVTVTLEGCPRLKTANNAVIAMLAGPEGLGDGFRTVSLPSFPTPSGRLRKPYLHTKLYCFSHPTPVALIGSFNPTGDNPEVRPDIAHELGNHDRGHNLLIGLRGPKLVDGLTAQARMLNRSRLNLLHYFSARLNGFLEEGNTKIYFWPRLRKHPIMRFLYQACPGARIRIAASHLKGRVTVSALTNLARRGANLEVITDSNLRRVPTQVELMFSKAEIPFARVKHPEGLPMHNKFVIVEKSGQRWVIFGSFNWTTRSYWLNYEIGAISTDDTLFKAMSQRWESLKSLSQPN